jgi:malonyl CoA-acyl carrier protein transacylase/acyl carrier protein
MPEERSDRVAWLFPGQGSQYHGMFDSFVSINPTAARALAVANSILSKHGHPTFDELAWCQTESLGENVWHTQAAMLVADWVMLECLRERGYQPTLVSGHSYGEFAAMLAAGCWDFENALLATWHRCQSIVKNVPTGCSMLSIHASREKVEQLIHDESLPLYVSHINAPEQIVVGGKQAAIAHLSELLDDEGIGTRILAVPTAFHTPALQPAQPAFRSGLAKIEINPPRIPLLSSITHRYEADPAQIVDNLVDQLIHPVDFMALCKRLKHDKIGLVLEVGPQQVLSRLVRQNLGDSVQVVATDHSKRGAQYQLLCAEANLELFGTRTRETRLVTVNSSEILSAPAKDAFAPIHFDATQARRDRMRTLGRSQAKHANPYQAANAHVEYVEYVEETVAPNEAVHIFEVRTLGIPRQPVQYTEDVPTKHTTERIASFLIDFVVEQTGYPAEIIELDWDIEADLGIDSIKKAQLFGELREFFDLESLKNFSLDHYRTLRDIAKLLEQTPGKGEWLQTDVASNVADIETRAASVESTARSFSESRPTADSMASSANLSQPSPQAAPSAVTEERLTLAPKQLQQFLIDFVVEQTGYPAEIVELDADLEADLGIDSIKKAQLFGDLREMFSFNGREGQSQSSSSGSGGRQSLADYRTLRDVMDSLLQSQPASTALTDEHAKIQVPVHAALPVVEPDTQLVDRNRSLTIDWDGFSPEPARMPVCSVATKCEWPIALITNSSDSDLSNKESVLRTNKIYREALASNLRAMVGRKIEPKASVNKNGNGASHTTATQSAASLCFAEKIAETSETLQQSILALDKVLLTTCVWRRAEDDSLATLDSPAWLNDGGGESVGLVVRQSGTHSTIQLMPAGCLQPGAVIHDLNLLAVGGVTDASQPNAAVEQAVLSQWISEDLGSSFDDVLKAVRNMRVASDWWLKLFDARSGQQAFVEARDGVLVIERGTTLSKTPVGKSNENVLSLQFDPINQCFQLSLARSSLQLTQGVLRLDRNWLNKLISIDDSPELPISAVESNQVDVVSSTVASRYILRMAPASQRNAPNRHPTWGGTSLIVGDNPIAHQLEARIRTAGFQVVRLAAHACSKIRRVMDSPTYCSPVLNDSM